MSRLTDEQAGSRQKQEVRPPSESVRVSHYLSDEDRESLRAIRAAIGNQGFSTIVHMALFRLAKELRDAYGQSGANLDAAVGESELESGE